ncbi:ComEC/Rec2 family competence protein [Candidatus Gottesmanbacteria bacterium]|nr:ComEC/Rec2 family competence protein [Candidatus Gottesmanbacteria bacterium]
MTVENFTSVANSMLPEPHAGLLNGILFGTKATLSRDLYDQLVKTGTLHIIALSGMNITILTNLVSITLLRFISRWIASLLTIGIIIGFIFFVGPSASVVRAGVMGSLALLAVVFGRQTWSFLFLAIATGSMLIVYPAWIFDIGFQLSVLATLGIILFGKKLEVARNRSGETFFGDARAEASLSETSPVNASSGSEVLAGRSFSAPQNAHLRSFKVLWFFWSFLKEDLRVTLAAQVFTIPILLFHFHRISLIAPLPNVLIGWVIAPVTALGLVTVIAGWIWLPLGQVFAWITWVPLQYVLTSVWITSMLPFASMSW